MINFELLMTHSILFPISIPDNLRLRRWALISFSNLTVVAALGLSLRYKGAFYFPAVNYKYLLNAHSHFAFSGWITTALFVGMLYIRARSGEEVRKEYRWLFWFNQLASLGMLISFMVQGYGPVAIFFSALSVAFSYGFAFCYWRDLRRCLLPPIVVMTLRLALVFLVLSSAGPYLLAYSMAHRLGNMTFYYNSIYLYLHFQYNGWFSFGVMGLFFWMLHSRGVDVGRPGFRVFVGLMGAACVPAYGLSLLWMGPPAWLRVLAASAALMQVAALMVLLFMIRGLRLGFGGRQFGLVGRPILREPGEGWMGPAGLLVSLSMLSFVIKLSLQALSVVPALGSFAFSFRPVIIGYLHLVVLGFISFFLLGFFIQTGLLSEPRGAAYWGLSFFIIGVIGNELVLLVQSGLAMGSVAWTAAPYYLLAVAALMFVGLAGMCWGGRRRRDVVKEYR